MPRAAPPIALAALALMACTPLTALIPGSGIAALTTPSAPDDQTLVTAQRLMQAGAFDPALRAYMRAAAEQGITAEILAGIGTANLHLGRIGQAETYLTRALDRDPDFIPALNNLGVVYMEQGRFGEARRTFQAAYALDSGATEAIRDNLRRAIALTEPQSAGPPDVPPAFTLTRIGPGHYALLPRP